MKLLAQKFAHHALWASYFAGMSLGVKAAIVFATSRAWLGFLLRLSAAKASSVGELELTKGRPHRLAPPKVLVHMLMPVFCSPRGNSRREGYVPASNGRTYRLCAADTQGRWRGDLDVTPRRWANTISEPFHPQPGDELEFTLQMTLGGWVVGRVVDLEGMPVVGVEVVAVASDGFDKQYVHPRTITGADGRYRLGPMRPGEHQIVADAQEGPNFFPTDLPLEGRIVSIADGEVLSAEDLTFIAPPDWEGL